MTGHRQVEPLSRWLRRNAAALAVIAAVSPVWAFFMGNAARWAFGDRLTSINNRAPTRWEAWMFFGESWAVNTFLLACVLIALTAPTRWRARAGVFVILLAVVGCPASWAVARIAREVMSVNFYSGPDWMELSAPAGLAAAWTAWLAATALLERYRIAVRVIRRVDGGRSLCPVCRFDLSASVSGVCPECGWTVPPGLRSRRD
jgi:hypothetical protein